MPCLNHAEVLDGLKRCTRCQSTFCPDCLVELKGGWFCAECKGEEVKDLKSGVPTGVLSLAGIGVRFAAQFLDGLILGLPLVAVMFALGMFAFTATSQAQAGGLNIIVNIMFMAVGATYEGSMLAWRGQTLGKMAAKVRVVTPEGRPISGGQAWTRAIARSLLGLLWIIDYLPAFFTAEKTCLHDMIAKTRVVKV